MCSFNYCMCDVDSKAIQEWVLTVYGHLLDHKIFIVVSGHDTSIIAGEFNGWVDDMQGPVY